MNLWLTSACTALIAKPDSLSRRVKEMNMIMISYDTKIFRARVKILIVGWVLEAY